MTYILATIGAAYVLSVIVGKVWECLDEWKDDSDQEAEYMTADELRAAIDAIRARIQAGETHLKAELKRLCEALEGI